MEYLEHHGIKGQKWGIRRYQNLDGTLTAEGRKHYNSAGVVKRELNKTDKKLAKYVSNAAELKVQRGKNLGEAANKNIDERVKVNNANMADANKRIDDLLAIAKERGYNISSKEVTRYAHAGRVVGASYMAGALGASAMIIYEYNRAKRYGIPELSGEVKGRKYYVNR